MEPDLENVMVYCQRRGWSAEVAGDGVLVVPIDMRNGPLLFTAQHQHDRLIVRAIYPIPVPSHKRVLMAEFVSFATTGNDTGAIEYSQDDGEIAYKSVIHASEILAAHDRLIPILTDHLVDADKWLPGVGAVAYTDVGPRAAMRACVDRLSPAQAIVLASTLLDE